MIFATSCKSKLEKSKQAAIEQLSEQGDIVLKKIILEKRTIKATNLESIDLNLKVGVITVLKPESYEVRDNVIILEYSNYTANVMKNAAGQEFSSLPKKYGNDDLEKIIFLSTQSKENIEKSKDIEGVTEAIAMIKARATILPYWVYDRIVQVESPQFRGLLSGDFITNKHMELVFRPTNDEAVNYVIVFINKNTSNHNEIMEFTSTISYKKTE